MAHLETQLALHNPVASEQPSKQSRLLVAAVSLGILRTDLTAWVISSMGGEEGVGEYGVGKCLVVE